MLALAREAGERGGTYPCAFNAANEVAVAAFLDGPHRLPRDRGAASRTCSSASTARPARDLDELREADARARDLVASRMEHRRSRSSGWPLLVMIHEAGHFFAARAVGMTPRKFYLGFGPPIAKHACAAASSTASARSRSAAT